MADLIYEKVSTISDNLTVADKIRIGGVHTSIDKIVTNDHDELVLHLTITGASIKKRSKMMLILPKKTPITILK